VASPETDFCRTQWRSNRHIRFFLHVEVLVYFRNQPVNDFSLGRLGLGRDALIPVFPDPLRHQR
jgi:hypothetical protein